MAWLLLLAGLSDAADGWLPAGPVAAALGGSPGSIDRQSADCSATALVASTGVTLWVVWVLLARELLILVGVRRPAMVPASGGKAKTTLQFLLYCCCSGHTMGGAARFVVSWWLFWPSLVLLLCRLPLSQSPISAASG